MLRIAILSMTFGSVLAAWSGCGKEETPPVQPAELLPENPEGAENDGGGKVQVNTPVPEGHIRLKTDGMPVLAQMNGSAHRVHEIDELPYTGKVMEFHANGMEKKEIVYADGQLTRTTEWHENGQKKMESKLDASGLRQESYWDQDGSPQKKPAPVVAALGRKMNWSYNVNARSIDIAYRGKSSEIILKGFGEPDDKTNGVWVYRGMKVQTARGLMTTVRFVMQNDIVFQVSVEP